MDCVATVQNYIQRAFIDVPGMKALLLDAETAGIVSLALTQTQVLEKEVYLVEPFSSLQKQPAEKMTYLKVICFVRPTQTNVDILKAELLSPRFAEYHVYFTNALKPTYLEELADADEYDAVMNIQELFADYFPIQRDLFSLNMSHCRSTDTFSSWDHSQLSRALDGIMAVLISHRMRPVVGLAKQSPLVRTIYEQLGERIESERASGGMMRPQPTASDTAPLLLLLDRKDDPLSPLLSQWTYQAMVHELLGIRNNRVSTQEFQSPPKDLKEVILSADQDEFFAKSMFFNYGELTEAIHHLIQEFGQKSQSNKQIETLDDMQRFLDRYPEFRKFSGSVRTHVLIVSELSRLIDRRRLLDISELEQEVACFQDHETQYPRLLQMLRDPALQNHDKLRLLLLFLLRYEGNAPMLLDHLEDFGFSSGTKQRIQVLLQVCGEKGRSWDLYGRTQSLLSFARESVTRGLRAGFSSAQQNALLHHQPYLSKVLQALSDGRLAEAGIRFPAHRGPLPATRDVVIFFVDGVTYAEARVVREFNTVNAGKLRILLGGTTVLRSKQYVTCRGYLPTQRSALSHSTVTALLHTVPLHIHRLV
eukprot:Rmarinus@m.9854